MDKAAVILIVIAVLYCVRDKIPFPLFRFPGDIYYDDGRWTVIFPITSIVLTSLAVSFVMHLLRNR